MYSFPFKVVTYFLVSFSKVSKLKFWSCLRSVSNVLYEMLAWYMMWVFAVGYRHKLSIFAKISLRSLLSFVFDKLCSCRYDVKCRHNAFFVLKSNCVNCQNHMFTSISSKSASFLSALSDWAHHNWSLGNLQNLPAGSQNGHNRRIIKLHYSYRRLKTIQAISLDFWDYRIISMD